MTETGIKHARELTPDGFYYDNLHKMAQCCHEETDPERFLAAYVLEKIFLDLSVEVGEGPVIVSELRKLEARYRTVVNLALEKAAAGVPLEEQHEALLRIIRLLRDSQKLP
jgi:hypothetical protein